ncbi:MAG: T9SS type A sorting domain-containing protein [Candidatus Kapabacteria bacterium]|nr:T9SS type A sorting domain-containing protein [Ignavibacteriota bacterium]MCW5885204.1 T9SS type A sorting domain-containing protein [Candidatus Kapabacteria bacterium]
MTFLINSGIYNGQIVLNSPLPRRNPIEFRGNSMFASDVVISFAPTAQNNFVILLNGMDRISFNNLTINNNSSNTSNGGILVNAMSVWGLDFNKVNFNGVANSPRFNNNYSIINMMNTSDVKVSECTFNNGSAGIYSLVTNKIYPNIEISKNDFFNFSWVGIYSQILESALPSGDVKFADNRFISNAGLVPNFGIQSWNSTSILRNEFSGITGSGNTGDAVIYVSHNTQNPNEAAEIVGNRVNGTNLNGIFVNGANTFINQNYVNIGQSGNLNIAAMRIINASGAAGNNQITGRNSTALDIAGSPNFDFVYNSVVNESNTLPTAKLNNANRVWRNIFANNGTGVVYHVNGISSSNENIFHTNGNILINDNGSQYANLNPWQAKGFDRESDVALIEFESLENLNIKYYSTSLLAGYQLFTGDEGYLGQLELFDFGNVVRRSYFVGSHELLLAITIERQTDGFVDCVGSTDNYLTVSSAIDYNAPMTYQWELDGSPIHGETEPILYFTNLRHNQAGIYKCLVMGPGATTPVYSREVAVYVTRPTDITTQPQDVFAFTGETVVLSFEAHANGKSIENAIANDEVKVNWYKYVSEANDILLTDNHKIAGSKSNYLTIRNFGTVDQGEYYAVIQGLCGTVETDKAELLEAVIDLNITQTPSSTVICEGNNASFIIAANTSSNYEITYEWMKDGTPLQNIAGKVDGANTNALNIMNCEAADAGNYSVLVTLVGGGLSETRFADLTVNKGPAILLQPQDAVVEAGRQLMLDVVAEGNDDQEVLNYKWFHNGTLVQDSDDMYYIVDVTTPDNAGEYYVVVSNNCGDVTSETVTVTITTGTSSVVEVFQSGYSLTTATPNPVQSVATISFTVPTESFVKITMTDASGAGSIILAEGNYQTGTHNINFNAQDYNLASGTYFYYLESNGVRLAQKLVVIK